MAETATSRLMRELQKLQENLPEGVTSVIEDPNQILKWNAVISGLKDCFFQGGKFKVSMEFPKDYPTSPPNVKFVTKVFHPNVALHSGRRIVPDRIADGTICMNILDKEWEPTYDVSAILMSIQCLLKNPNPDDAFNHMARDLFLHNPKEYEERVKVCVEQSLQDP